MENRATVNEWVSYAKMDLDTAKFLYEKMYPKPLTIICYHCQQAAEKMLKAALASYDVEIKKTHDLGRLAEELREFVNVQDEILDICDDLTPYGVKIRYPQELYMEDRHAKKAAEDAEKLYEFLITVIHSVFGEK